MSDTAQWYELNPSLYRDEVALMRMRFPDSTMGRLDDGRLYFTIDFKTIASGLTPQGFRPYRVMMVYNSDHPNVLADRASAAGNVFDNYGGSVKVYPLSPSYEEMSQMWSAHCGGTPPHILYDEFHNHYLCIEHNDMVAFGTRAGDRITCGADYAAQTARWLNAFEVSMVDRAVREKFCRHTDNN